MDKSLTNMFEYFAANQKLSIKKKEELSSAVRYSIVNTKGEKSTLTIHELGFLELTIEESTLNSLLKLWIKDTHLHKNSVWGQADWPAGWRDWYEEATWLKRYIADNGYKNDLETPEEYKIRREILFHDYMFRQKSFLEIEFRVIKFVVENWLARNCFMNLNVDSLLEDIRSDLESSEYHPFNSNSLAEVADCISSNLCNHCGCKAIDKGEQAICPQTKTEPFDCVVKIHDSLLPYISSEIIAFTKSNLLTLTKHGRDIKWHSIIPKSPIEIIMGEALMDAGIITIPQYQAFDNNHKYKIDYIIDTNNGPKIAVECDGLQFHARSSTYIKDRIRDRYLQKNGFYIMRFSSVEIFNNIQGCIKEVDEVFWKIKEDKLYKAGIHRSSYFGNEIV